MYTVEMMLRKMRTSVHLNSWKKKQRKEIHTHLFTVISLVDKQAVLGFTLLLLRINAEVVAAVSP